jgi:hypothetical protein
MGIGQDQGKELLSGLLACREPPSLVHFVRSLVGLDRAAAHAAFSKFLNGRSLTPQQDSVCRDGDRPAYRERDDGCLFSVRAAI